MITRKAARAILSVFAKEKTASIHLRELARRSGLHVPSITKELRLLEKEGYLESQRDGNLKKYRIKKGRKAFAAFVVFDVEAQDRLPAIKKQAIEAFLDSLKDKPIITVLFGSTAKGTAKKDSDIDILLITNKRIDTKNAKERASAISGIEVSAIQISYDSFIMEAKTKEDKVVAAAIATGYPLTNHIMYYEAIW